MKLSDLGSGDSYKTTNGYAFPYGHYMDIAVNASGPNFVIWSEGTNYVGPEGSWFTKGV